MSSLPVIYAGRGTTIVDIDHNRWLRDVLSHQIPDARIMSFYYDFAKNIAAASWKDLIDQTLHFLFALRRRREETLGSPRPLVFMCFSFGSVILKKALLVAMQEPEFRQIFDNTSYQ
ncbi:hypothetical protein BKA61DRAFT_256493 [Leptodontidium sp. MPI-SDFR-AT-0119]|nr:hypothetical protein BKA61DRAFT_256493 [Leptodontidium sp. MPI-SDFR-AT-0119]